MPQQLSLVPRRNKPRGAPANKPTAPKSAGGRPKGSINSKRAALLREAAFHGISPFEVMLNIMREEYNLWLDTKEQRRVCLEQCGELLDADNLKALKEIEDLATRHRAAAMDAATSAAPYAHPKLASLALTGEDGGAIKEEKKVLVEFLTNPTRVAQAVSDDD